MRIELSVPSKTFLFGEYAVLYGGPALLAATEPRFCLQAETQGEGLAEGLVAQSPAGQWLRHSRVLFENFNLRFVDPHEGRGGFGASGAQFALVHALSTLLQSSFAHVLEGLDIGAMWSDFRLLQTSQGAQSGADLVAQTMGGLVSFRLSPFQGRAHVWPFTELSFLIARTGQKLNTHEHLVKLDETKARSLTPLSRECLQQFEAAHATGFLEAMQRFAGALEERQWVATHTQNALTTLRSWPEVKFAKGCGAMGADTLLVLCAPDMTVALAQRLNSRGWEVVATTDHLSPGLKLQWQWQVNRQSKPSVNVSVGEIQP